jgi:C-methyltransferase C-terminal domain/Putative zinc binding domain/Methyltransferase domain
MNKSITNYIPVEFRPNCRFCHTPLRVNFVDLGMSPLCESYISADQLNKMEPFYPLHTFVCEECFLVQLDEYVSPGEIFTEYAYFSSYSDSWVQHAKIYTEQIIEQFGLGVNNIVMEIASNDGYLLQHFAANNIPVMGIEPAANIAKVAEKRGIPTIVKFFGENVAKEIVNEHGKADLVIGNNVLAHVPDLNDFVGGMKILLRRMGLITMEFPHLYRLMESNQFDTIYHEHFSYFSFLTVEKVFLAHGMKIFDVEELSTHGGSLRIYACHVENEDRRVSKRAQEMREREIHDGYNQLNIYADFEENVKETKRKLLEFLIKVKREGKAVAAYGTPGKGNTLLNYCGIRQDFIDYTVDRNPYKHNKFTPGTHIPIFPPERIKETKPDYVLILPWNLKGEIMEQVEYIREWGGQFVIPIPEVTIYP